MAALTACDELVDASARIRSLEEEVEQLRNAAYRRHRPRPRDP